MTKLLIIDDNDMQHELIRCYVMNDRETETSHAMSLNEALSQLKTAMPDIILLDNRLHPFEDFTQTAPTLRKLGFKGCIAVISAEVDNPMFRNFAKYGVEKVIDKSVLSLSNFTRILRELRELGSAHRNASQPVGETNPA